MRCRKQTVLAVIFWVLTAVCCGVIFYYSSCDADTSHQQSTSILKIIYAIFGRNAATMFIVRKCAHFLEFTGTSLVMSAAFYYTLNQNKLYLPIAFTSLYAVSDEVHQIFVNGRSCELRDWAIDTLGAVLGACIYILIYTAVVKIKELHTRRMEK